MQETDGYYHNIEYSYTNNHFSGTSAATFAPNTHMTRGMLVTLLGRMSGTDVSGYASSFDDVSDAITPWATEALNTLVEKGIVSGSDGRLKPNTTTTRTRVAQVIYNPLEK